MKVQESDFVENILRPCYNDAIKKLHEKREQYSVTAWDFIRMHSILRDADPKVEMAGCKLYPGYETVFLTDTVQLYEKHFHLEEYEVLTVTPGKVLSQDMYCRFLTYRVIMPNLKKGDHITKLYSMK